VRMIVSLRRAGVMPEEIRLKRVAQVKTRHRKDTIHRPIHNFFPNARRPTEGTRSSGLRLCTQIGLRSGFRGLALVTSQPSSPFRRVSLSHRGMLAIAMRGDC